jgi:hypothetical protein
VGLVERLFAGPASLAAIGNVSHIERRKTVQNKPSSAVKNSI